MKRGILSRASHDDGGHGHAKPWVWCMIDAFILITAFFVCTFHVAREEPVLPHTLGKVRGITTNRPIDGPTLRIDVTRKNGEARYECLSASWKLADLQQSLLNVQRMGTVRVRVSYEAGVQFGDVMAVINACSRARILDVGLVPMRG